MLSGRSHIGEVTLTGASGAGQICACRSPQLLINQFPSEQERQSTVDLPPAPHGDAAPNVSAQKTVMESSESWVAKRADKHKMNASSEVVRVSEESCSKMLTSFRRKPRVGSLVHGRVFQSERVGPTVRVISSTRREAVRPFIS